jgi:predicted secreted protein
MVAKGLMRRVALPTFATAVTTSGIAVAITYATAWRNNVWGWVAVGVLTLVSAGVSVWLYFQQQGQDTAEVSGIAELTIRRNNKIRKVRANASRHAKVDIGRGSSLGTLQVTAGIQTPRAGSGSADTPQQRSRADREPAAMSDETDRT